MRVIKIIGLLQIAGVLTGWQNASAQKTSIDGDTIYVHEGIEQAIAFIAEPSRVNLDSKDYDVSRSRKLVTVMPRLKDTKPGTLTVQEGPREHRFVIMYTGSTSILDVYDISNPQKLEEKYNDFGKRKLAAAEWANQKVVEINSRQAAIDDATNDYKNGRLEEAQKKFQKLLGTDPVANDSIQQMLIEINASIATRDRDKFYSLVMLAKSSAKAKNYDKAIEYSDEALKMRPTDTYAKGSKDDIIKARDEDKYQSIINTAQKAIVAQNYDDAKKAFDEAKNLRPSDPQLKAIGDDLTTLSNTLVQIKKDKEVENQYNRIIAFADSAYKKEDYKVAKEQYTKASNLLKNKPYPRDQVKLIDTKLADIAAKQKAEKDRLEKEERANTNYRALVDKGNTAMEKKDYAAASRAYQAASDLKSTEQYPKDKLEEIKTIQAEIDKQKAIVAERVRLENENQNNYTIAMNKGKSLQKMNALENAKIAYTEASRLYPAAVEPKIQIAKIDSLLAEIARRNSIDERYNNLIHMGDSAFGAGNFNLSMESFQKAKELKPNQTYPVNQMKFVERRMQDKAIIDNYSAEDKLAEIRNRSRKAKKDRNWPEALKGFREVLALWPNDEEANLEIRIILNQLDKGSNKTNSTQALPPEIKKDEKKPEAVKNSSQAGVSESTSGKKENKKWYALEPQRVAFPYNIEVLKSKYPDIDFTTPPPEQKYNQSDDYKEYYAVIKDMFNESPRLNIRDSANNIKVIVQNMSIRGSNTYIRLAIQNTGDADFLLGPMLLSWHKKFGSTTRLYPGSIYPATFPVVAPGKEYSLVYVSKDSNISDQESLSFELGDREKKTSLLVKIPGAIYNSEKKRL